MKTDSPRCPAAPARPRWRAALACTALAGLALASCGDAPAPGAAAPKAAPAAATPQAAAPAADPGAPGSIEFTLDRGGVTARVPVTMCAGFGAVLNVVGMADGVQVDVQVVENPAMRADMPLKMATTSGYRIEGTADGKRYQEVWTSKRNDTVEREGLLTRVSGVMTGIRMEGIDDTRYGPPAPIDGQREVPYTLTAQCAG
jgi:hypothetical protein